MDLQVAEPDLYDLRDSGMDRAVRQAQRLPRPRELGLPFARWRSQQIEAMEAARQMRGQYLILQLPTGAGKSGVAAGLAAMERRRTVILTATKGLQEQYREDAPFLVDMRGMGNYPCLAAVEGAQFANLFRGRTDVACDEGPCRSRVPCGLKQEGCLYFDQYHAAINAHAVVTNYAYWCSIRRYGRGLGAASQLMCDEAHALPEQLMQACRIEMPHYEVVGRVPRTISTWKLWATAQLDRRTNDEPDRKAKKARVYEKLTAMAGMDADSWEWEETAHGWAFEPVIPRLLLPLLADAVNERVLFLSATVTPGTVRLCGVDHADFQSFESDFPSHRRPIYLLRTRRIDHRATDDDLDYWVHRMDQIQRDRQDRKGIIHTHSYKRADWLSEHSRYRRNFVTDITAFRMASPPAVLVSPTVTTGYDFPDDDARYQIIAKVPFPDTRSRIAKARIQANERYQDHVTMQTLVQTCGRIVRSRHDWGETFIVDDHARWFIKKAADFAPAWFLQAVKRIETLPDVLESAA